MTAVLMPIQLRKPAAVTKIALLTPSTFKGQRSKYTTIIITLSNYCCPNDSQCDIRNYICIDTNSADEASCCKYD